MKSLVIFESTFGNTKQIAEAIAKELGAITVVASAVKPKDLKGLDLLVVGSPIIGWMPEEKMGKFLATLQKDQLTGAKAATFDTRVKLFIHGDAMGKIAKSLEAAGAELICESHPFYVKGKEGPLLADELTKAVTWAQLIKSKIA
jgi:flavodoxin